MYLFGIILNYLKKKININGQTKINFIKMQQNVVYRHEVNQEMQINFFQSQFGKCFVKYNKTTII